MSLTEQLQEVKNKSAANIPTEVYAVMSQATKDLLEAELSKKAPKTGETLKEFSLPNAKGNSVNLKDILAKGNAVVSFYRGGWCPYCNLELKALNDILPQLKELNTTLVAITPETPDNSLSTSEKNELEFEILSDIDNQYAKELNLVFQMPEKLREIYHSFNLHVDKHNGNENYELPMPATFIVDNSGEILYAFVPEDYTERLDPETILEVLKK
ncbi:peroxiredoxin-like family protein [Wenyingzhuangia sp. IMCC45533]